jgi:hypothetical protein
MKRMNMERERGWVPDAVRDPVIRSRISDGI